MIKSFADPLGSVRMAIALNTVKFCNLYVSYTGNRIIASKANQFMKKY